MRVLLLGCFCLSGLACTAALPDLPAPTGGEVTVFVPGYKGSFLREESGDRAWLTVGQVLSSGDTSLALPFPGERPARTFGPLAPDGPLTRFTVLPLLARKDVYLGWMEFGRDALPGFVAFSYDWRRDVRETGGQLCAALDGLAARQGPSLRVNLVVHSMGGLLALQCLRSQGEGARRVKRAVFVGTPFRGVAHAFEDLLSGTSTGRNRALLSREALFSFPSVFQLMPVEPFFWDAQLKQQTGPDPWTAEAFVSGGWGVFADPAVRADPAYHAQLEAMLGARAAVVQDARPLPPFEALAVVGVGRQTISGARVVAAGFDFEHPALADGDGSVTSASAHPPFAATVFESHDEHTELLNDGAVRAAIAAFLIKN